MSEPRVDESGTGHVFGAPTGAYMGLTCFQNGSLARERVRADPPDAGPEFSHALASTPRREWRPHHASVVLAGDHTAREHSRRSPIRAGCPTAARDVRAVVEAQMLSMALHSRWMGARVDTIHATGGAAVNREILQVMADVFGARVFQMPVGNSAALGAALRAAHAHMFARNEATRGRCHRRPGGTAGQLAGRSGPGSAFYVSRHGVCLCGLRGACTRPRSGSAPSDQRSISWPHVPG